MNKEQTCEYRLSGSNLLVEVRHPLLDMWVLEEIFRFGVYEPPAPVARLLRGLGRPVRILDLGGHIGCFGLFMLSLHPDATLVSYEPDPANLALLRRCIEANGLSERWRAVEACAGTRNATVEFASSFHLSRVAHDSDPALAGLQAALHGTFPFLRGACFVQPAEGRRVRSEDVLGAMQDADLVKLDIEGSEWAILADPRFGQLSADAVVLEYHPAYLEHGEAEQVVADALRRAGYTLDTRRPGPDGGMVWAWRQ